MKVHKLKSVPFETAIIERYRRQESSVEEALIDFLQKHFFCYTPKQNESRSSYA